jgi:hypothetical protein
MSDQIGWILVHSTRQWPDEFYDTPEAELLDFYRPGVLWHWRGSRPFPEGGPYTLLFSWRGEVFGHGRGEVTHKVEDRDFNMAFRLSEFQRERRVPLTELGLKTSAGGALKLTQPVYDLYLRVIGRVPGQQYRTYRDRPA